MHVISKKVLRMFWTEHPESKASLMRWYRVVSKANFATFQALRQTFPSADMIGSTVVFNIGGSNYRLIAAVHFNRKKLYVRHVLTHREYDRGGWKI